MGTHLGVLVPKRFGGRGLARPGLAKAPDAPAAFASRSGPPGPGAGGARGKSGPPIPPGYSAAPMTTRDVTVPDPVGPRWAPLRASSRHPDAQPGCELLRPAVSNPSTPTAAGVMRLVGR